MCFRHRILPLWYLLLASFRGTPIDPCLNVFRMYFCLNVFLFCLFAMQSIGNGGGSARASPRARPLEQFPTHQGRNYTPLPPPAHASLLPASPAPRATRSSRLHGAKFPFFFEKMESSFVFFFFFCFWKGMEPSLAVLPSSNPRLGQQHVGDARLDERVWLFLYFT